MRIEDEIKVMKFRDNWHKCTVNILFTASWLTRNLERRAAKVDITLQQFNALRILRGQLPKPTTNNLLGSRLINNTPDIPRLIDRIVSKGLVLRTQNKNDKRAVDLFITDRGLDLLQEIEDEMMLTDLLPGNLSDQEAEMLTRLLDKLRGSSV
ncbi:MAG: MarR family winged helix-turn-helix transcriptional regulator [Sphingobacterium sp.]|uniref:MarR family winged helix-turn-helix transcriptional regulator n=1 Tax=Sphingobacterium sp. JB170 TaxID=1434842 RepID=UPI00097F5011|nr:MarR family transcriptional regulator [Sphingobacterium sp. JB170]SJN38561.1 Transcriptional regulator, MarR family [Sphingobacterium sp. JB170]